MGKHGPCYHCGVTSTPLWRNGPPEKPVLCNACGSRWRTKGTLANYTPLHSRAEPEEFEDSRFSKVKTTSIKNNETKFLKRKFDDVAELGVLPHYNQVSHKGFDVDASNRSSSGSAISNSESCAQYGSADASGLTGPPQSSVWDSMVPSRKRTCVSRSKTSSVEKLTKDLYAILHEQQSSCLSGSSEEELLLESGIPMVSVEIGHGSVLIRHPCSITQEEESEASSFSIDNKQHTVNSRQMTFPGFIEEAAANSSSTGIERIKKRAMGEDNGQNRRDKDQLEKLPILAHHNSPLCYIDLHDILNFEKFSSHLTNDEQQQLVQLLPSVDTLEAPYNLKRMFDSAQFNESLISFQKLLADGVFDNSLRGFTAEDCRILKLTKSQWVEKFTIFEDLKRKNIVESEHVEGCNTLETVHSASMKRSRLGQHQKYAGSKVMMEKPRRIIMKSYDRKELIDGDGSFSSVKSGVSMQNENGSLALDSSQFDGESCEQDLLLDVLPNGSFPQAELHLAWSFGALPSTQYSKV